MSDIFLVVEWDTSLHVKGLELWLKAVLADGGAECERLCKLVDEPLIPGMLVGQLENRLSQLERQEVYRHIAAPWFIIL